MSPLFLNVAMKTNTLLLSPGLVWTFCVIFIIGTTNTHVISYFQVNYQCIDNIHSTSIRYWSFALRTLTMLKYCQKEPQNR